MHLDRKALRREQQLHQQRKIPVSEVPRLPNRLLRIWKPRGQARLAPHFFAQGGSEANRLLHGHEIEALSFGALRATRGTRVETSLVEGAPAVLPAANGPATRSPALPDRVFKGATL